MSIEDMSKKHRLFTLKEFLEQQDPNLTDETLAAAQYAVYKAAFLEVHLKRFFDAHKSEDWYDTHLVQYEWGSL
jgi:hypothetical protein